MFQLRLVLVAVAVIVHQWWNSELVYAANIRMLLSCSCHNHVFIFINMIPTTDSDSEE
jgi:hypothetical protein